MAEADDALTTESKKSEKEKDDSEESTEKSKKGGLVKIIVMGVALLVLLGGGYFAYATFFTGESTDAKASTEEAKEENEEDVIGPMMPMKTFIVNLADTSGKRYLKIAIELELSDVEVHKEIEKRNSQLRDSMLVLLSSKRFSDINTSRGKNQLRGEIISRLNKLLPKGQVKQAYFTEFVVQ